MDWKLAKSLYIIVFLLINIFLIILYLGAREDPDKNSEKSVTVLENTDIDMSAVDVDAYEPVEMSILTAVVENFTQSDEDISVDDIENSRQIKREFESDGPGMDLTELQQYKNDEVYKGDEYSYDEVMSTNTQKIFNQVYDGFPVFNHESARLVFSGEATSVQTFEQTMLNDISVDAYTEPAYAKSLEEAVEGLFSAGRISDDAVVLNARLGYFVIFVEEDQVMLRPKWEFYIEDQGINKSIYVDATSDTEEIIESE